MKVETQQGKQTTMGSSLTYSCFLAGSQGQEPQDAAGATAARNPCRCTHHHQRHSHPEQPYGDALLV